MSVSCGFCQVIPSGFEPETHSLEGCCSIQLSYGTSILGAYNISALQKAGAKVGIFLETAKFLDIYYTEKLM